MADIVAANRKPAESRETLALQAFQYYEFNTNQGPVLEQTRRARALREVERIVSWYGWQRELTRAMDAAEAVTLAGPAPEPDGDTFGAEALWADAYARASARLPRCLRDVIIRRALAGDMQQWEEEAVSRVAITHENGRPRWYRLVEREAVTRDGRKTGEVERAEMIVDVRREPGRRPGKDCYQKYRLEPDPIWMIEARAVYTAWRAALDLLHAELEGQTTRVILMPAQSPWEPWQQPEAA